MYVRIALIVLRAVATIQMQVDALTQVQAKVSICTPVECIYIATY